MQDDARARRRCRPSRPHPGLSRVTVSPPITCSAGVLEQHPALGRRLGLLVVARGRRRSGCGRRRRRRSGSALGGPDAGAPSVSVNAAADGCRAGNRRRLGERRCARPRPSCPPRRACPARERGRPSGRTARSAWPSVPGWSGTQLLAPSSHTSGGAPARGAPLHAEAEAAERRLAPPPCRRRHRAEGHRAPASPARRRPPPASSNASGGGGHGERARSQQVPHSRRVRRADDRRRRSACCRRRRR